MISDVQTTTVRTSDGRELCVEVAGDPSGYPVLYHAGTPNSRHLFTAWIDDAETRGIMLLGYDRPGYGRSTPHPGHSVADGAADARAVADEFGISRMATWGISGGGPYALACAALLPDLVVAAAVIGSVAPWGAAGLDYFTGMGEENVNNIKLFLSDPEAARAKAGKDREELLGVTADQIMGSWKTLVSPADAAVLNGDYAEFLVRSIQDGLGVGDQGWWDDAGSHLSPWGFELETIRVPVKVWHGREDRFVAFQHGEWLAAHIPGAESVLSDTDGHLTLAVHGLGDVHQWLISHF